MEILSPSVRIERLWEGKGKAEPGLKSEMQVVLEECNRNRAENQLDARNPQVPNFVNLFS
jgi:hypothetical protein